MAIESALWLYQCPVCDGYWHCQRDFRVKKPDCYRVCRSCSQEESVKSLQDYINDMSIRIVSINAAIVNKRKDGV